jgi:hypothetical protein
MELTIWFDRQMLKTVPSSAHATADTPEIDRLPYTSRYRGPDLTPEERDVAGYSTDGTTSLDWTPVAILYRRYLDWFARTHWADFDAPARLTVRGVRRCKRAAARRHRRWGYAYLEGPFSVVTPPPRRSTTSTAPG